MDDVSRWQLVGMALLATSTGAQLLGEGITRWLWAAVVAVASAGAVLAWRWRFRAVSPVPSVDDLYVSAATLVVVLGAFGAIVWLQIASTELFYVVAHGTLGGWFLVFLAERIARQSRAQTATGA